MYNRIMVPLDGSELAEVTLWYAARLTGRLKAALTLVYVSPQDELASPHMHECYLKDVVARVKKDADKAAKETGGKNITVDFKMLRGDPAEEIVDYADKAKIDLIILSTQGKSGIKRWPLGNVANKVVGATRKQVLLIRAKGAKTDVYKGSLKKVLVPVDGSKQSESILRYITHLAKALDLDITLQHVWVQGVPTYFTREGIKRGEKEKKQAKNYILRLESRMKSKGVRTEVVFGDTMQGSEAEEIIKLAEEGKYSMVAMATHGWSAVERWIFGSTTNKVLNEGSTPLLLARPIKSRKKASS
ncbi:MAG: universal stress protein [Dehalococcoidales bacterium]|nr:universal stress protein [Dehalococcoidales bacterium]